LTHTVLNLLFKSWIC